MSFLNTPGTDGYNSVTREEAVNLLLTSIAQEEAALSKLMDAERNKVLYTINRYRHGRCDLKNVLEINKSVDSTIKNMMKYQMLLQHKLENVKELLASFPEESTEETAHAGAGAAKCSPKASSAHLNARPAPKGYASTGHGPACSARQGSEPKRPHPKCPETSHANAHAGTTAAECLPKTSSVHVPPSPAPKDYASTGHDPACSARQGSEPKRPHPKCPAEAAAGRDCPGQKCCAKKRPGHPSPKCSAEKTPAEKRCRSMPRVSARGPRNRVHASDGACRCARKSAANRKAAMLRTLLFCFLPFGLL
jgi:hypothetical protein